MQGEGETTPGTTTFREPGMVPVVVLCCCLAASRSMHLRSPAPGRHRGPPRRGLALPAALVPLLPPATVNPSAPLSGGAPRKQAERPIFRELGMVPVVV